MSIFERIAEARITEAMDRGEFDDLAGAGRPLEFEDLSRVPADMRLAYKVLRNAEVLPPEVELRREIYSLGRLIDSTVDEDERAELRRRRRLHELRYSILIERRAGRLGPRSPGGLRTARGRVRLSGAAR
ncbi:MAG TPA: DUF1992 domain-containing protein [Solirubrobacterales bacterium]|nr:DUF1992 domain-containing protein [Solirubrobacterales bacterium]